MPQIMKPDRRRGILAKVFPAAGQSLAEEAGEPLRVPHLTLVVAEYEGVVARRAEHQGRARAHRCCWRELKPAGGQPRGPQSQWLHWLSEVGQDAGVWRPADWHTGRIAAELEVLNLPPGLEATAAASNDPDPERAFFRVLYAPRP